MGFIRDLTGKTAVRAAGESGEIQRAQAFQSAEDVALSGTEAIEGIELAGTRAGNLIGSAGRGSGALLDPFAEVGQRGIDLSGFLGDPTAQFDFLQQNPLFQQALENVNQQTQRVGAARGRLSAGDTLEQLAANTLQVGQPLLQSQRSDILNLLNLGRGVASEQGGIFRETAEQRADIFRGTAGNVADILRGTAADVANLQTGGAAAQAAGIVGEANARGQTAGNILTLVGQAAGAFSDKRLKTNIVFKEIKNGHNIYTWVWNKAANSIGLFGDSSGVIAQEVKEKSPGAISYEKGFMKVNYSMIGI